MLTNEFDAPRQSLCPRAGDSGIDECVEHLAFGLTKPGHRRCGLMGEQCLRFACASTPRDSSLELTLEILSDGDALVTGFLAEPLNPTFGSRLCVNLSRDIAQIERSNDGDFIAIDRNLRCLGEPSGGKSPG
jgi:hypothetical protein